MATKKEVEVFKQMALKMSRYRLRRALKRAGMSPEDIREVEVEGEDEMVSVLVTKFKEGDIDMVGLEQAAGKSLSDEEEEPKKNKKAKKTDKKTKRKAKRKDEDEDEEEDPYSSAFDDDEELGEDPDDGDDDGGDDDGGDDGGDDGDGDDDDGIEKDEIDEEPPPRKAKKSRKKAKKSSDDEIETNDAVLQQLMDMQLTMAEVIDGLNDEVKNVHERLDFLTGETLLFHEIVKFAFARIWKTGAAKTMKPAFSDVIKKGKELFKKRLDDNE